MHPYQLIFVAQNRIRVDSWVVYGAIGVCCTAAALTLEEASKMSKIDLYQLTRQATSGTLDCGRFSTIFDNQSAPINAYQRFSDMG